MPARRTIRAGFHFIDGGYKTLVKRTASLYIFKSVVSIKE